MAKGELMDSQQIFTLFAMLVLGAAGLWTYLRVFPTIPRDQRLRLFTFVMLIALVAVAIIVTGNPLALVGALLQSIWRDESAPPGGES